jgi:beta-lactamase superfamily II metal-dependent hydrolase
MWNLEIHTIDVGQGDSSLIIFRNPPSPPRSILIDGGAAHCAAIVDAYVKRQGLAQVDVVVASHFDDDHSDGLISLFAADNVWATCDAIATIAAPQVKALGRYEQVAGTAAAVTAVAKGAHGTLASLAAAAAAKARDATSYQDDDYTAAKKGVDAAFEVVQSATSVFPFNQSVLLPIALAAGTAGADGVRAKHAVAALQVDVRNALLTEVLVRAMDPNARFDTGGRYRGAVVVDPGDIYLAAKNLPFKAVAAGGFYVSRNNTLIDGLGCQRSRLLPKLGQEILFGLGPSSPPAGAPVAIIVSGCTNVWQGQGVAPFVVNSGQPDNDISIGIIVQVGGFAFFTAGDLPSQGEDALATAMFASMNPQALPDPRGGSLPTLDRLSYAKLSHHGSSASTSTPYLTNTKLRYAVISAGPNCQHQHPTSQVVTRLESATALEYFYLTNCGRGCTQIPATVGQDQLLIIDNKSRVSGDDNSVNTAPNRNRGDVVLRLDGDALGAFTITFWNQRLSTSQGFPMTERGSYPPS